ncbi:membrane protein [Chitiniphilus shinanonensis]|uniref:Membrane protein n=2 Tax=Chitiniphilus shinanonensis TaxID=553088 RepID=A0ABQ6BSM2_9NEIS|nr:membrane protein [Chitiniphilus shinanonensis]
MAGMNDPLYLERERAQLDAKRLRLRQARTVATCLLVAALVLFLLAEALIHRHPFWSFVGAFAEAAMVGALADWFAVTALFRHPMGIPIPHTAIIPRNKLRIANSLGGFIETHFLSEEQVALRIDAFNPARRVASWLSRPSHVEQLAEQAQQLASYLLSVLDEPHVRDAVRRVLREGMAELDWARHGGELLAVLLAERQHQQLLDRVLDKVGERLAQPDIQTLLSGMVAQELSYLKWVALDEAGGRYVARKLVAAVAHEFERVRVEPEHPLRRLVDSELDALILRLQHDEALRERARAWVAGLAEAPAFERRFDALWQGLTQSLHGDFNKPDSLLRARVASAARRLRDQLRVDPRLAEWVNSSVRNAATRAVARYRQQIGAFIADQLKGWDDRVMVERLELNVGVDLQFIRINGTLVGGLIGLLLHSAQLLLR